MQESILQPLSAIPSNFRASVSYISQWHNYEITITEGIDTEGKHTSYAIVRGCGADRTCYAIGPFETQRSAIEGVTVYLIDTEAFYRNVNRSPVQ